MAGELRHATGAYNTLSVDVCNSRSVVHMEQYVLAS